MFLETLIDAFADERFVKLENHGDLWGISWKPHGSKEVYEACDDDLERLCETFIELLESEGDAV